MEKKIKENLLYSGKILQYYVDNVELDNSKVAKREIVKHPGGVAILVIKDGFVYLEKQYRYPFNKEIIEIPAGKLEKNENLENAAKRELKEELGFKAKNIQFLGDFYPSVGYTDEIIHLFFVNDYEIDKQNLDEDENLEILKMKLQEFENKIKTNEIKDGKTIAAYHLYKSKF